MIVFLNGEFVPEEAARVSVFDRSFLYGDGLFETLPVYRGKPFRWAAHLDRLARGATYLRLALPYQADELKRFASELLRQNGLSEAVLRIHVSRGCGKRGYSIQGATQPTVVMTCSPAPELNRQAPLRWKAITSAIRVPTDATLATLKTANKLAQILARTEAENAGVDEALMLNTQGEVAEATSSNMFWITGHIIGTPPTGDGALAGITRQVVRELSETLGLAYQEHHLLPEALKKTDGVFLTLSTLGIVELSTLDGAPLPRSTVVEQLRCAYWKKVEEETAPST